MEKKQNVPALRFPGFSGEWKERKISDIADIIGGGTPSTSEPAFWDGEIDWYAPAEMTGKRYADGSARKITKLGLENSHATILPADKTVLFTSRAGIGKVAILKKPAATNQGFQSMVLREDNNPYFLYSMGPKITQKAEKVASGSTFLEISGKGLGEISINLPVPLEQERIAHLFEKLDDFLETQKDEIKKLQQFRQAMLTKLFPREGAAEPELRFRGFSGAWKKRKVKDILIERNEQAPKSEEYPLKAFIANEGIVDKGKRYDRSALVTDTEAKLYKKTQYGDFIYSSNNLETGSIGLNKYGNASISPVYSIFYPTELGVSDFIGYRLVRKDFIREMVKWRQGVIYGQWRIPESDFLNIDILVPSIEEQRKIGSFFRELDDFISLQQKKLERMQRLKTALLEKLFV